jgi:septum site-determining protein MinC
LRGEAWPDLQSALIAQIESQPTFFQGGRLVLDVGEHILKVAELSSLRDLLSDHSVSLWAVLSESPTTEQTAQNLGLATRISKPRPEEVRQVAEVRDDTALWIRQTVRSGTRIEFPSHVVVLGDVNPGAEIISGGSVIVWGRLRGVVHAGAEGDDKAVVCALELSPTQLRIAGELALSPKREGKLQPEIAFLKDGQLLAEHWKA